MMFSIALDFRAIGSFTPWKTCKRNADAYRVTISLLPVKLFLLYWGDSRGGGDFPKLDYPIVEISTVALGRIDPDAHFNRIGTKTVQLPLLRLSVVAVSEGGASGAFPFFPILLLVAGPEMLVLLVVEAETHGSVGQVLKGTVSNH